VSKLVRLKLTREQAKAVQPLLEKARSDTGLNDLFAVVHQQWDLES
jgi:hypothetical protein